MAAIACVNSGLAGHQEHPLSIGCAVPATDPVRSESQEVPASSPAHGRNIEWRCGRCKSLWLDRNRRSVNVRLTRIVRKHADVFQRSSHIELARCLTGWLLRVRAAQDSTRAPIICRTFAPDCLCGGFPRFPAKALLAHASRASAFAVYTAIATSFSSSLISVLKPCPLWCHRQNVLQVFPMWLQVFPCGCEFSNLHMPSTR